VFYALNDLFLRQLACKTLAWTGRSPLLVPSISALFKSEAETWYLWLKDSYGRTPTRDELKQELLVKFAQSSIRKNALRDKLRGVPYDGPKKMGSYVSQYRYIETQIPVNEMAFYDRFCYFIAPFSGTLQRHLKREQPKTMEFVYDAAMEWANIETSTPSTSTNTRPVMGSGRSRQAFYALIVLKTRQLTRKTLAWTGRCPLLHSSHQYFSCN